MDTVTAISNRRLEALPTPAGAPASLPTAVPIEPIKLYDFENGSVMGWMTKEAASFIEVMKLWFVEVHPHGAAPSAART